MSLSQREAAVRRPLALVSPTERAARRLAPLLVAALVSACGGGDPVSTPTSVGVTGGTPTVTSAGLISTAATPSVGQGAPATFYVTGTSLENVVPSLNGCASMESSISNKSIVVQCTEVTTATSLTLTLTSQQGQTLKQVAVPVITVTSLALTRVNGVDVSANPPATVKFGDRVTYTIKGTNLTNITNDSGSVALATALDKAGCINVSATGTVDLSKEFSVNCDIADLNPSLAVLDPQGFPILNGQELIPVNPSKPTVTLTYVNESNSSDSFNVDVELQIDKAPLAAYSFLCFSRSSCPRSPNTAPETASSFYLDTSFHAASDDAENGSFVVGGQYTQIDSSTGKLQKKDTTAAQFLVTMELPADSGLSNTRGAVGFVKYNPAVTSNPFPFFFINLGDNSALADESVAVAGLISSAGQLNDLTTKVQAAPRTSLQTSAGENFTTVPTARYKVSNVQVSFP